MKTIIILFDSLRRDGIPFYGGSQVLPNFEKLAKKSLIYDNFYASSLPCIPARRDIHTGRMSFLNREWGPLEAFDESVFRVLDEHGIPTHIVTDHYNYWEASGGNYHNQYSSFEFVRGQEGDRWKGECAQKEIDLLSKPLKSHTSNTISRAMRYNQENRKYFDVNNPESFPGSEVFNLACDYIDKHAKEENWVLQIESMSTHEPFFSPDKFKHKFEETRFESDYDWPRGPLDSTDTAENIHRIRQLYQSLIMFLDYNLGKVLETIEENDLWDDVTIMLGSDHGILLGEHGYWSKNVMPMYNEIVHLPFYLYHPKLKQIGCRTERIAQLIDISASLYDIYDIKPKHDISGRTLFSEDYFKRDREIEISLNRKRDYAIFGTFSGHVNIFYDNYIYMRSMVSDYENYLFNYTLNPIHMRKEYKKEEMEGATLVDGSWYSNGFKHLKIPAKEIFKVSHFGDLLFDQKNDYAQLNPIEDVKLHNKMKEKLLEVLYDNHSPNETKERFDL